MPLVSPSQCRDEREERGKAWLDVDASKRDQDGSAAAIEQIIGPRPAFAVQAHDFAVQQPI